MPQPDDYIEDAPAYFSQVMKDENVDADKRIFATAYYQSMAILRAYVSMKKYMQVFLAAERAVEQYKGTFRRVTLVERFSE